MDIQDADFYWGEITREEQLQKLKGAPNGSFLVRNSITSKGQYTLVLKVKGAIHDIRIYSCNGFFGFTMECCVAGRFASVLELIDFHRTKSLVEYSQKLDSMLLHAVSRKDFLVQDFISVTEKIRRLFGSLERLSDDYKNMESDIGKKRQRLDAFKEAEDVFSQQLEIQDRNRSSVQPHEFKKFLENVEQLRSLQKMLINYKRELEAALDDQRRSCQKFEMEIHRHRLEIGAKQCEKKEITDQMLQFQIPESLISKIADEGIKAWLNQDNIEHKYAESCWLLTYDRDQAKSALKDTPTGTFLIRPSTKAPYALSISANGIVHHCVIYQTDKGNFGFGEPYNIYKSLKELVLHYSTNSLEEHNESLSTTLLYPLNFYLQNRQSIRKSKEPEESMYVNWPRK